MIRIRATVHRGFWRCGRHFGRGWQEFDDDAFSAAELEVLEAEPMLVVERSAEVPAKKAEPKSEAPAEKAPEAEGKSKGKGKGK